MSKVEIIKKKAKEFGEKNPAFVQGCKYGAAIGATAAFFMLHRKYEMTCFNMGLATLVKDGYMILTKPTEDGSIPRIEVSEWCKLINEE